MSEKLTFGRCDPWHTITLSVLCASVFCSFQLGCCAHGSSALVLDADNDERARPGVPTIEMELSAEQFRTFRQGRERHWPAVAQIYRPQDLPAGASPRVRVVHPGGEELLPGLRPLHTGFAGHRPATLVRLLGKAAAYYPDILSLKIDVSEFRGRQLPLDVFQFAISFQNLISLQFQRASQVEIPARGMELLATHGTLRGIDFDRSRVSDEAFSLLGNLKTIRTVAIGSGVSPHCLLVLAQLPELRSITFKGVSFAEPITGELGDAIASLNGRLISIVSPEIEHSTIHGSYLQAFGQVKSLEELYLPNVISEATLPDVEALSNLHRLRWLVMTLDFASDVSREERDRALALYEALRREAEERATAERQPQPGRRSERESAAVASGVKFTSARVTQEEPSDPP
jgi:hypothetical protein